MAFNSWNLQKKVITVVKALIIHEENSKEINVQ
jgi:hypothetical protein